VLHHHGISGGAPARIARTDGRQFLEGLDLPEKARERVTVAVDDLTDALAPVTT
jgi:hypothetical protein